MEKIIIITDFDNQLIDFFKNNTLLRPLIYDQGNINIYSFTKFH